MIMENTVCRTIVVSAVNIRKGGTLTILRQCLQYLSTIAGNDYRVVALVHKKELCEYPDIRYIELPNTIRSWGKRLKCEYYDMMKISQELAKEYGTKVYLWLSLHDTTPSVEAEHRAVYCQTSFPFYMWKFRDFKMDFKIPLFAMFTRFAYQVNVHKNDYLIVQAEWLRSGFSKMLGVERSKFIVAPPKKPSDIPQVSISNIKNDAVQFFFASTADCHKNFECLCEASRRLEEKIGPNKFKTILTIKGNENKYAQWLHNQYGQVSSIVFEGFMSKERLFQCYNETDCFVFPSKIETWGLPISEFMSTGKPMLLADLPYAHETSAGAEKVQFFNPSKADELMNDMLKAIEGDMSGFKRVKSNHIDDPMAADWDELFVRLLSVEK